MFDPTALKKKKKKKKTALFDIDAALSQNTGEEGDTNEKENHEPVVEETEGRNQISKLI